MKASQQLIARIRKRERHPVDKSISGLDEQVYVCELSVAEIARLTSERDEKFFGAYALAASLEDLQGEKLFTDEDAEKIANASREDWENIFGKLFEEVQRINGMLDDTSEDAEKNSEAIQSDVSGSN